MRVLISGGTGLIGSNLAREMLSQGHEVFVTGSNSNKTIPDFKGTVLSENFTNLDWKKLGKIDVVFHQAAINDTTLMDKDKMFSVNVERSKQLFKEALNHGCKRIVYASSTAVYGKLPAPQKEDSGVQPLNVYAESKVLLDEFSTEFAKQHPEAVIVGLRYCNVYGPGENFKGKRATLIYQLAQHMLKGNPKIFKFGEQKRDYIYVKDVVTANLMAAKAKESCIVNVGTGTATTFNRVIEILNNILGTERKPEYIDNPYTAHYQDHTECDMTLSKEKIGFVAKFSIESGIKDYYECGFLVEK